MVEAEGRGAQPPLEAELLVVRDAQSDVVQRGRAGQEVLGQGRAVIGGVRLVADDHDAAVIGLVPERARSGEAGQRGPHHGDRRAHAAPSTAVSACT